MTPGSTVIVDIGIAVILGRLEDRGGHSEDSGISAGNDRDPFASQGKIKSMAGAFQLNGVARGMSLLMWSDRQPIKIRAVSHHMIDFCEHRGDLGSEPAIRAGPKTDNKEFAAPGAIDHVERPAAASRLDLPSPARRSRPGTTIMEKYGTVGRIDVSDRQDALLSGGRPLDIVGVVESAGLPQRLAYAGEGPAQFHDRCGVGIGEPAGELGYRQGAGQDSEDVLVPRERGGAGRWPRQ